VVLSAVTTALAFAALGVAQHRGLASLGRAVAVGVACCLPAMLVLLPALLRLRAGPTHAPSLSGTPGPKTGPGGGLP
jgi:predicted RND superfamily exporter protein